MTEETNFFSHWGQGDPAVFTGGNASLRLEDCASSFQLGHFDPDQISPGDPGDDNLIPVSQGFRFDNNFADVYLDRCETLRGKNGLVVSGSGGGGAEASNINLHIRGCVFDQAVQYGMVFQGTAPDTMNDVVDTYVGMNPAATAAVLFTTHIGNTTITGGQLVSQAGAGDCIGIYMTGSNGVKAHGVKINNMERPVAIETSTDFDIEVEINNPVASAIQGAITSSDSNTGYIRPSIKGKANAFPYGVHLIGTNNHKVEVNCTLVDSAAITAGAAGKLRNDTTNITATGLFNTDCLASGIMT